MKEAFASLASAIKIILEVSSFLVKENILVVGFFKTLMSCYHFPIEWCFEIYPSTTYTGKNKKRYFIDVFEKGKLSFCCIF